jgi:hypothetical protein
MIPEQVRGASVHAIVVDSCLLLPDSLLRKLWIALRVRGKFYFGDISVLESP